LGAVHVVATGRFLDGRAAAAAAHRARCNPLLRLNLCLISVRGIELGVELGDERRVCRTRRGFVVRARDAAKAKLGATRTRHRDCFAHCMRQ